MHRPNITGKARKAVKRIILRTTFVSLCGSSWMEANTGCATCAMVPDTRLEVMLFHLKAWVKLPTVRAGNRRPKITVSMFWLMVVTMEVNMILQLNPNICLTGPKSTLSEGRHGISAYLPRLVMPT